MLAIPLILQHGSHCIMMFTCHVYIYTGPPSRPQALTSTVVESYTNYSTVEVTWDPPDNDSRGNKLQSYTV